VLSACNQPMFVTVGVSRWVLLRVGRPRKCVRKVVPVPGCGEGHPATTRTSFALRLRFGWRGLPVALLIAGAACLVAGCAGLKGELPSQTVESGLAMPVPRGGVADTPTPTSLPAAATQPSDEDMPAPSPSAHYVLDPVRVINLAFNNQPAIKQRYQSFKAEEARYDFFYTSRDSLTPGMRVYNKMAGERDSIDGQYRDREHVAEMFVEKRFFNTSRLSFSTGYHVTGEQWTGEQANHPFVAGSLRYPLSASREALQRASEQIVRQNDLDNAKLQYLETVRTRLLWALFDYYGTIDTRDRLEMTRRWLHDLRAMTVEIRGVTDRDVESDLQRVQAEVASVEADWRDLSGRLEVRLDELKSGIGLSFDSTLELMEESFNPFAGVSRERLLELSLATDPEIATLRNGVRNAQAQLDLARRGKWDAALIFSGESALEGDQGDQGSSQWQVSASVELRRVDERVTTSLEREALANIERNQQAIRARENNIYVGTLDPMIRMKTLTLNIKHLTSNLDRYQRNYDEGLTRYRRGELNIDDLLSRRQELFNQQSEIINSKRRLGDAIAQLCSATGKFFDLINEHNGQSASQADQ